MPSNYRSAFADDIEAYLSLRRSLGYETKLYIRHLRNLDVFCAEEYPQTGVLSKEIVMSWIEIRETECVGTQHIRAAVIRMFGRFQASEGKLAYILPEGILAPAQRYVPHISSDDELARLFIAVDLLPPDLRSHDRHYVLPVVLRLLLCCGLRPGEPLRLRREDVDLEESMLTIRDTKRHKSRLVAMSGDVVGLCKKYDEHAGERELFFERPRRGAYTAKWTAYHLARCYEQTNSGLTEPPIRPYDLRHRFATTVLMRWVDEGINVQSSLPRLAQYMGHTEISDTLYYVHLLTDRLTSSPGINWKEFSDLYPKMPL